MTTAEAQAAPRSMAEELLAIEDRLREMLAAIPRSPREDEMLEGAAVWDLEMALRANLECVLEEQLEWVVETLERARSEPAARRSGCVMSRERQGVDP